LEEVYDEHDLFIHIVQSVSHDDYFRQMANTVGLPGATTLQKVIASFCMLPMVLQLIVWMILIALLRAP
jgi:hypothetical protein